MFIVPQRVTRFLSDFPPVFSIDATKFTGSAYHKISGDLSAAVQMNWAYGSDTTGFALGLKKQIDADTFVKAKVDNSLKVSPALSERLIN